MNDRPYPIAGEDYPRTYQAFLEWFADEPLFYRLMEQAVMTAPLPYRQIIQRKHNM